MLKWDNADSCGPAENLLTPLRYTGHFVSLPLSPAHDDAANSHTNSDTVITQPGSSILSEGRQMIYDKEEFSVPSAVEGAFVGEA